jgi:hypothetical protein
LNYSFIIHFLNSNIIELPKDQKLISLLYKHIDNIELINNALNIISMRAAGWTSVHRDQRIALEESLKKSIPKIKKELQECLDALKYERTRT